MSLKQAVECYHLKKLNRLASPRIDLISQCEKLDNSFLMGGFQIRARKVRQLIYYPFNRLIKRHVNLSKDIVTITGQFITEIGTRPDTSRGYDPEFNYDSGNPQTFHESYLMRYELEQLTGWAIDYLKDKNKRSGEEILRALQIVREEIWRGWDEMAQHSEEISD